MADHPPLPFDIAAGTAAGRAHVLTGRNNQDSFAWAQSPGGLVAVVCDGCGSSPHSEVGAQLGARLVAKALALQLARGADPAGDQLWQAARVEVLETLGGLAAVLGGNPAHAIGDFLLFTAVGVIVTPQITRCFAAGDGIVAVNGAPKIIGPFPDNAPPYLAYALFENQGDRYQFELQTPLPTAEVESVMVGTDGAAALLEIEEEEVPGLFEKVGPLSALWTDDRIFADPDFLRRRLLQLTRDAPQGDGELTAPGLLTDDATVIVLRRQPRVTA